MSKADEYRNNAVESYALAQKVSSSADKGRLLKLAEKWLDLAERSGRRAKHPVVEHPLVAATLGDEHSDHE
jgi:hypothetical protein